MKTRYRSLCMTTACHPRQWSSRPSPFFWKLEALQSNNIPFKTRRKKILNQAYFISSEPHLTLQVKLSSLCSQTKNRAQLHYLTLSWQRPKPLMCLCLSVSCLPCSNCFGHKPKEVNLSHKRPLGLSVFATVTAWEAVSVHRDLCLWLTFDSF